MKPALFLLIVLGQCELMASHLYDFHYIHNQSKTWHEARQYCRHNPNHTDLAMVVSEGDVKRILSSMEGTGTQEAWIGLHQDKKSLWYWTRPRAKSSTSKVIWLPSHPKKCRDVNCAALWKNSTWGYGALFCNRTYPFLCYNESTKRVVFIDKEKNWLDALSYCRENHTDLFTGDPDPNQLKNLTDQKDLKDLKDLEDWYDRKNRSKPFRMWIGLFRHTWAWSNWISVAFRNWNLSDSTHLYDKNHCAVMTNQTGQWRSMDCSLKRDFFCYDDNVILIQKNLTWEDALYYCRDHHHDLVSITNPDEQTWVQKTVKKATSSHVWTGLRYTCTLDFWFWVSDEVVEYKNWAPNGRINDCDMSGAMDAQGPHQWFSKRDNQTFNFLCTRK